MTSQAQRQENLLSDCINSLKLWKEMVETYLPDNEQIEEIEHLQEVVKSFCLINFQATNITEALQEVVDYFNDEDNDHSIDADNLYKEKLSKVAPNTNYQQNRIWKELFMGVRTDQEVEEVAARSQPDEAPAEFEEMQDSIYYSNVFTPPVDPISKMIVQDPYKNKVCGHIYEHKFIVEYIKTRKNKAKCPFMGCGNVNIALKDLIQDKEMKEKIENYQQNSGSQLSNEDDDSD